MTRAQAYLHDHLSLGPKAGEDIVVGALACGFDRKTMALAARDLGVLRFERDGRIILALPEHAALVPPPRVPEPAPMPTAAARAVTVMQEVFGPGVEVVGTWRIS